MENSGKATDLNLLALEIEREERAFKTQTDAVAMAVLSRPGLRFITLAGPTCSGKTTTAKRMLESLYQAGKRVLTVSIDDFYLDVEQRMGNEPERTEELDFESVKSIDLLYFRECAGKLLSGDPVYLPAFNFESRRRSRYTCVDSDDYDYILFEGIQAVYPEVLACLGDAERISVFSSVRRTVTVDGASFTPREVRLCRRLVRDFRTRNATADFTFFLWDDVVENEDRNIFPNAEHADFQIDSLLSYEMHVLRDPLLAVTEHYPCGDPHYDAAMRLREKVALVTPIPSSLVPPESICREFIGGEN